MYSFLLMSLVLILWKLCSHHKSATSFSEPKHEASKYNSLIVYNIINSVPVASIAYHPLSVSVLHNSLKSAVLTFYLITLLMSYKV